MNNRPITDTERRLMELARALAAANPDAAANLAKHLGYYASEQKSWRGCGIVLRLNEVEGRVEMIVGER